MQKRFTSIDEDPGEHRCPSCGMRQSASDEATGSAVLATTCRFCENPLPSVAWSSPQDVAQLQWQEWMDSRRLERWIWFLFVFGMVIAGLLGLVRS